MNQLVFGKCKVGREKNFPRLGDRMMGWLEDSSNY